MDSTPQEYGTARLPAGAGADSVVFATAGSGPPLLVVPGWLTHLELSWAVPAERLFYEALAQGRTLVRYDRPGCGLSAPYEGPRTMELELATIDAVADAIGAGQLDLFGFSTGASVAARWAAENTGSTDNTGRVGKLVLYGGWADGAAIGDADSRRLVHGLISTHWGLGSDLITNLFAPDADAGTRKGIAEYQRAASSAATAAALLDLAYRVDITPVLSRVETPTLVLHRKDDRAAPFSQGRVLADGIPGARFVELEGRSHLPAFGDADAVVTQVRRFLGLAPVRREVGTGLTPRQREVAALVADGLTNRQVAEALTITERSAESHVERIRLRLGFRSRAQIAAWYVATTAE